jgi:hypothetical protein
VLCHQGEEITGSRDEYADAALRIGDIGTELRAQRGCRDNPLGG